MTEAHTNPAHAAVVGIGCRLPGGIRGPLQLWQALMEGHDAIGAYPPKRWKRVVGLLAEQDRPEQRWQAGLLDGFGDFDAEFFAVPRDVAERLDPLQRHLMEVTVEALYDAGIPLEQVKRRRVGVFVGSASVDGPSLIFAPGRSPDITEIAGAGPGMLAAPLAHYLDLRGPVRTIDTACSSTATAVHEARRALQVGEIDLALVAGVSSLANPVVTQAFAGSALAPDGRSKPFDAAADGYGRSEGVAVVVLKRAAETDSEADRTYGVVTGSYLNHDGARTSAIGVPSADSQVELVRGACADAGITPDQVGYVEAHGTGTPTGDNRELKALACVFDREGDDPLLVGSIKGNIGHLEGAAGLVGLIKTCLVLHHGQVPPTVNHRTPRTSLATAAIEVPTTPTVWPINRERFALVSSFGFSGSNGVMVVGSAESAPRFVEDGAAVTVPLSARTRGVLTGTAADLAQILTPDSLVGVGHVASTAAHGRDHHTPYRAGVVATKRVHARRALEALAHGEPHRALVGPFEPEAQPSRVVWAFAGHGTQNPGMGSVLYRDAPVYATAIDEVVAALQSQPGYAGWHPATEDPPWGVDAIQQAIFATQVAQARTLMYWGLGPDVVVGHSVGEIAAAHLAGILDLDQAARLVCARSRILATVAPLGGMLATQLSLADAREAIAAESHLEIAAENGPFTTVITGPEGPLDGFHHRLAADDVWARRVADDTPAHSGALEHHLEDFAASIEGLCPREGAVEMVSTVTGAPIAGSELRADYWVRQLRQRVQFHSALVRSTHVPCLVLELGSVPVLQRPITEATARHALPATVITAPTVQPDEGSALQAVLAESYARGLDPAWPHPVGPPAPLPPPRWHYSPDDIGRVADLDGVPAEELPQRVAAEVHRIVATLVPVFSEADRDTDLTQLGINSLGLWRLRAQLADLHPKVRAALDTDIAHAATINGITRAVLDLLIPQPNTTAS